jgi:O-6-methylguanine DNA methyltransferase
MATDFEKRVWEALKLIPKGKVTTYKEIANFLNTKGIRAVANAVAKNPYAPKIPCHRVVKSNAQIGGYSAKGGVEEKIKILKKEGILVKDNKIVDFKDKLYRFKNYN